MMAGALFCERKEGWWSTRRATATNEERGVSKGSARVKHRKRTKDNDGDVDRAENAELVGLFEETILALDGSRRQGEQGRAGDQASRCQAKAGAKIATAARRRRTTWNRRSPSRKSPTGCVHAGGSRNESQIATEDNGRGDAGTGRLGGIDGHGARRGRGRTRERRVRTVIGWISILRRPMACWSCWSSVGTTKAMGEGGGECQALSTLR